MRNIINIAILYIGTIIGAGFASGQEIYIFFVKYGFNGVFGVCLAFFLISILGGIILMSVKKWGTTSYHDFFHFLSGKYLAYILDSLFTLYMFCGICIMLAGAGSLLKNSFHLPLILGTGLTVIITIFVLRMKLDGIFLANKIIVPTIFLSLILMFILNPIKYPMPSNIEFHLFSNWSYSALLYACYNLTLALSVFCTLGQENIRYHEFFIGALLGGMILGVLALLIVLMELPLTAIYADFPLLEIIKQINWPLFEVILKLALWGEIFSTLVGNVYGLTKRFVSDSAKYNSFMMLICLIAWPFSLIGFTKLLSTLYPLFGTIFLALIIMVISQKLTFYFYKH
jgi:uncharacterized membrane protein YkvI